MPRRPPPDLQAVRRSTQQAVLAALAAQAEVEAVVASADPGDPSLDLVAGDALLALAAAALAVAVPDPSAPLEYAGLRQRYLPEVSFIGRVQHRNSQYALYAAACQRAGLAPDLDSDAGWWQAPLWIYSTYALVIYARAAAERTGSTVAVLAQELSQQTLQTEPE